MTFLVTLQLHGCMKTTEKCSETVLCAFVRLWFSAKSVSKMVAMLAQVTNSDKKLLCQAGCLEPTVWNRAYSMRSLLVFAV